MELLLGKEDDDWESGGMRRLGLTEFFSGEYMTVWLCMFSGEKKTWVFSLSFPFIEHSRCILE